MEDEVLQFAGDINVEEVYITSAENPDSYDLTNFMVEFNLFEDIFSPTMHGSIVISDTANLITELPMIGTELLTVKFRTPTLEDKRENIIEKTFQIFSIVDKSLNNDRSQLYTLEFVSKEAYLDNAISLSKTFSGNTADIAQEIFDYIRTPRRQNRPLTETTGLVIMDTPHASQIKYTSNYWSPIKNIGFIGRRVKGAVVGEGDFILFEGNKNFYFTGLEALIASQNTVFDEYVYELQPDTLPRTLEEKYGNNFPSSMTRIEEMTVPKVLDILDGQDSGYFGSVLRGYDMFTKQMTETVFDARNEISKFVKTQPGLAIPGDIIIDPNTQTQYINYNSALYPDYGLTSDEHANKVLFRKAYLNSFNQFKFQITIPGRTDIEVGNLINILYPSPKTKLGDETEIDDIFDPLLSGRYLISAINHRITSERHVIIAEVIKNGLSKDLGERRTGYNK